MIEIKIHGKTILIDGNELLSSKEICYLAGIGHTYLKQMKRAGFKMIKIPGKRSHFATWNNYLQFHKDHPGFTS